MEINRLEHGIYNRREAAQYLGVSYSSLAAWASTKGGGPAYCKLNGGGRVVYRKADLDAWLEKQVVAR